MKFYQSWLNDPHSRRPPGENPEEPLFDVRNEFYGIYLMASNFTDSRDLFQKIIWTSPHAELLSAVGHHVFGVPWSVTDEGYWWWKAETLRGYLNRPEWTDPPPGWPPPDPPPPTPGFGPRPKKRSSNWYRDSGYRSLQKDLAAWEQGRDPANGNPLKGWKPPPPKSPETAETSSSAVPSTSPAGGFPAGTAPDKGTAAPVSPPRDSAPAIYGVVGAAGVIGCILAWVALRRRM